MHYSIPAVHNIDHAILSLAFCLEDLASRDSDTKMSP